jgi:type III secretory pathway lipoprotein EscJ
VTAEVTVAVAGDPVEADEIRAVLRRGGVESTVESAEVDGASALLDGPCRVLVESAHVERAMELLEADDDDEDEDEDDE